MIDTDAVMERLNHRIEEHAEACLHEIYHLSKFKTSRILDKDKLKWHYHYANLISAIIHSDSFYKGKLC
jgi:hypothetical protein